MAKYIQHFPKPLLDDLVAGRWLPVLGAGMSMNATLPPGAKMPLWPDLGTALAGEMAAYSSAGALDSISAYQHEYGRAKLIERLTQLLLIKEAKPGDTHRAFCSIPFDIVCTTNFDFLLERQYDAIPRYVYPVIDEEQLSINGAHAGTQLLKLHGDLRHPSRLVVTEEDYDGFLSRYPLIATYLANLLITNTAVFIGYSLDDPDFRQIWTIVSDRLGKTRRMAYAIMVDANNSDVARFERRGVKIINLPGSKSRYPSILADAFNELREHIRDNVMSVSKVTEEEPLRELSLPRDALTRLCFFSLPVELLSLYRSRVFPRVEELGFVPIVAEDVISPGQNISAKIDALIDRSSAMVVEMTSAWTRAEFDIAVARNRSAGRGRAHLPIVIVANDQTQVANLSEPYPIIYRLGLSDDAFDAFAAELVHQLAYAADAQPGRGSEAQRLLAAREYRAAVIAAISGLEVVLQKYVGSAIKPAVSISIHRPLPMRMMLDHALEMGLISNVEQRHIREWMGVRNTAIHEGVAVSAKVAKSIVDGVNRIIGKITGQT
ncbi:SIR2 family protein [Sphingomonas aerolata]|uniref:SIR2 family NAD-dependent protein deacylase n=1 Tax=Sphingomonas aerolata TaxID=185951 RepID=UPI002FE014B0